MLRLYAVTPAHSDHPPGLDVVCRARVQVVFDRTDAPPERESEEVLAFGAVIDRLARTGPLLPMRYGTTVPDAEALRILLAAQEEAWTRRLGAVAGGCELVVHVSARHAASREHPPPADRREMSGRDYLRQRVEQVRRLESARREIRESLDEWIREVRILPGRGSERLAVLVSRLDAQPARGAVSRWADAHPDLAVAVTGPWPPYSFCAEPGE